MINAQQQDIIWQELRQEAQALVESEPMLASFFHATILKHANLGSSLSYILANKLEKPIMPAIALKRLIVQSLKLLQVRLVILKRFAPAILRWINGLHRCSISRVFTPYKATA